MYSHPPCTAAEGGRYEGGPRPAGPSGRLRRTTRPCAGPRSARRPRPEAARARRRVPARARRELPVSRQRRGPNAGCTTGRGSRAVAARRSQLLHCNTTRRQVTLHKMKVRNRKKNCSRLKFPWQEGKGVF